MTIDEFLALMDHTDAPASEADVAAFEGEVGERLPDDYRDFLIRSNGGILRGDHAFQSATPEGQDWPTSIHHIGGLRETPYFSLRFYRSCALDPDSGFPRGLIQIMDDPGGNGICLGVAGRHRGRVYYWIHDETPDPAEWDGEVETAANVVLLADSFTDFIAGVAPSE